jgi:endonuclease YncB( thermonuclease family)
MVASNTALSLTRQCHHAHESLSLYLVSYVCREGSAPPRPEPFAREAKYFTESNLLHRDVQVVLRGVSKSDEFCGSVTMKGRDLGEELLRSMHFDVQVSWPSD